MNRRIFRCEAPDCTKSTIDVYTKGWMHVDGHIAVSYGREHKERDSRGISDAVDLLDAYFCSWDCFVNFLCLELFWNDPKMARNGKKMPDGT